VAAVDTQSFFPPDEWQAEGCVLRSWRAGDGPAIFEAVDSSRDHLRVFMPWVDQHASVEDSERYVRGACARYLTAEKCDMAVFAEDGRVLGGTGFFGRDGWLKEGMGEVGMWVRADEGGKGLASRVLAELLRWGFTDWPFLRLSWRCSGDNRASARVAEKAGMRLEGVLRSYSVDPDGTRHDIQLYGIQRHEWVAR
jgi:RimJ/RimL family protein N-acetyltransferase